MQGVEELFSAMAEAVAANDHERFDVLERKLLNHFDGGFSGMPRDVYQRYVEIDRRWPATPTSAPRQPAHRGESVDLGPRTAIHMKLPEVLIDWLGDIAASYSANRSDVVTACLRVVRENPAVDAAVREQLRTRSDA